MSIVGRTVISEMFTWRGIDSMKTTVAAVSRGSTAPSLATWAWIAARVMRHPFRIAVPVLALLLIAGIPFFQIQLSTGQNLEDLPPTPARVGFENAARLLGLG